MQMSDKEFEEYLRTINKTEEELHEELRPLATKRVTSSLVLGKVVEEEKIEASDSEIKAEVEKIVEGVTGNKDELQAFLNTPQGQESIKQMLVTRKTMQRLVEIAQASPQVTNDQQK